MEVHVQSEEAGATWGRWVMAAALEVLHGKELRFLPWNPPPKGQISPTFIPPRFTDYRMLPCTFLAGLSPSVAAPQVSHLRKRPLRFIWKCAVPTS